MSRTPNPQGALELQDLALDADLDLSDLTVTSLRDTAALPENGASWGSCSCQGSSSCAQPQVDTPVL
ncbi:thiazolylpeptide-type bacteriocin [Streptomyces sp. NPDC015171]|uniref:thiazolylpeptide-type bacteriocin n=1 Tax=Streptomyces sp. NPDC015171 TaxID=3364945 RepID=UPI003702BEA0